VAGIGDESSCRGCEFGRERHPAAGPAWNEGGARLGRLHPGGELAHAQEFEHAAGKDETIAGCKAVNEVLLDVTERQAVLEADRDRCLGHDGANADPGRR
jgi:hypothetical protein